MTKAKVAYAGLAVILLVGGGNWLSDYRGRTAGSRQIRLILDSPGVRRLLADQAAIEGHERASVRSAKFGEVVMHPEVYIPGRLALIRAMAQSPGIDASAERSYCRFLEYSRAGCGRDPHHDSYYVKVRIASGSSKNQEGWACMFEDVALNGPIAP